MDETEETVMKKKQRIILLCGVVVLLLGAYYGVVSAVKSAEEKAETEAMAEKQLLLTESADEIIGVGFTTQDDVYVTFAKSEDDTWSLIGDDTFDVDETILDTMVTDLTGIEVEMVLTEVEDLSEYGLDEPVNEIVVTNADEKVTQIAIGDANETTGLYYICLNNVSDTVYCISADLASAFEMAQKDMRYVEEKTDSEESDTMETEDTTAEDSAS